MDTISIEFLSELGTYDSVFGRLMDMGGIERVHQDVVISLRKLDKQDPERLREWDRLYGDIKQSQQKIIAQQEEISHYVLTHHVSRDEYDILLSDRDSQKREGHIKNFIQERMNNIRGILLSEDIDKRVQRLNGVEAMRAMRNDIFIDIQNIIEALSVVLINETYAQQIIRSLLDNMFGQDRTVEYDGTKTIDIALEQAFKTMLRALLFLERYERDGLANIHHLERLNRQIDFMLMDFMEQKHI